MSRLTAIIRRNSRVLNMLCICLLLITHVAMASTRKRALCPRGRYSTGVSAGQVPCVPCPRGRYGDTSGLKTSQCTAACPQGKFSNRLGVETVADCQPCPPNTWSSLSGVTSNVCTPCEVGKYNLLWGSISEADCLVCEPGYLNGECMEVITMATEGNINGL